MCHKTKPSERIPLHIVRIVSQYFALVAVVLHLRKKKRGNVQGYDHWGSNCEVEQYGYHHHHRERGRGAKTI